MRVFLGFNPVELSAIASSVRATLSRLSDTVIVERGTFGSHTQPIAEVITTELKRCDFYVGLVGREYGDVDESVGIARRPPSTFSAIRWSSPAP